MQPRPIEARDRESLGRMLRTISQFTPDEVAVGTGALLALGRIAPADLEARLAPFAARTDRPTVTHQVEQARVASQCSGSPGAPRP